MSSTRHQPRPDTGQGPGLQPSRRSIRQLDRVDQAKTPPGVGLGRRTQSGGATRCLKPIFGPKLAYTLAYGG
jgi:hypothetical protein